MSIRDELHELVDRLEDDHTGEALAYLRQLTAEAGPAAGISNGERSATITRARDFLVQQPANLQSIADQQGIRPVANFDDLLGDFWPEDETADEFVAAIREWRSEGSNA